MEMVGKGSGPKGRDRREKKAMPRPKGPNRARSVMERAKRETAGNERTERAGPDPKGRDGTGRERERR